MSFKNLHIWLSLATFVLVTLTSAPALAWIEQHLRGHEARVTLGKNGNAHVEQVVRLAVRGGPLRTFDVEIADRHVTSLGEASMVKKMGKMQAVKSIPVSMEQRPDGSLRIEIDERRGVRTGTYEIRFSYDVDLLADERITRDGAMLSVTWVEPKWGEGVDNDKCVFVIPTSGATPVAGGPESNRDLAEGEEDVSIPPPYLATLTRLPEVDEMTLIRPHVSKDEQVSWTVRVDPAVFAGLHDPRLGPRAAAAIQTKQMQTIPPAKRMMYLTGAAILALLVSILLTWKHHEVVRAAKATGGAVRPLIPVGIAVRVALAGPVLAVSVGAQMLLEDPTWGTLGVVFSAALLAYRSPEWKRRPRGPGKWLPISVEKLREQTGRRPKGLLDLGTTWGRVLFVVTMAAYGAGVAWVAQRSVYHAYLAGGDVLVLLVLFGTGRWNEQPVDRVARASQWLTKLSAALRKSKELNGARVTLIGRFPKGASKVDEVRLRVDPKGAMRGLKSIEVGLGWAHGQGGALALPEVLVRVLEGSKCHKQVTRRMGSPRWLHGRATWERVLVQQPVLPTIDFTVREVERWVKMTTQGAERANEKSAQASVKREATKRTARRVGNFAAAGSSNR